MEPSDPPLHILITGAAGFIGQALASALAPFLLSSSSSSNSATSQLASLTLTDISKPDVPVSLRKFTEKTASLPSDLTDPSNIPRIIRPEVNVIYILHGLMSSASEANLDLSLKVNIDSIRNILDFLREQRGNVHSQGKPPVKIIFASSTAVYGPPISDDELITERTAPNPGSSYGAQKHIAETLINDYSRRGLVDGRVVRLPTVLVRPGAPTGAASSFASGIFREPLKGEKSILPVSRAVKLWICSPRTVVKNLLHAQDISTSSFSSGSRIVNLPGSTVTVQEMLDALKAVGGDDALRLVEEQRDPTTERIVEGWPARLDTALAEDLGFSKDGSLTQAIEAYLEDYVRGVES